MGPSTQGIVVLISCSEVSKFSLHLKHSSKSLLSVPFGLKQGKGVWVVRREVLHLRKKSRRNVRSRSGGQQMYFYY